MSGLHLGVPPRHVEARVDDTEFRPPGGVSSALASSSDLDIAPPVPVLTAPGASSRYVTLEAGIPLQKQCIKPSWLQVVESWRNPDKDGAVVYEFCLWCNACNCPSSGCVCKHVLTGRIDHLREGNPAAWSDALLSPITRGREKTLYSQSGAEVVAKLRDDRGGDSDSSDEESAAPPRSILRSVPLADAQPTLASMLALQSRAQGRPTVRPDIAISCILTDLEAMHATWSDIESLRRQSDSSVLSVDQLRLIELAALAARKEHERATRLVHSLAGVGDKVGRLRRGQMLAPLRSADEGDAQAARFQPLGHPMYLSTGCPSTGAETATADDIETTPSSLADAPSMRQTDRGLQVAGSRYRLGPQAKSPARLASSTSACASTLPSPRRDSAGTDASLGGDADRRGRRHSDAIAAGQQGKGSNTIHRLPSPSAMDDSSALADDQLSCAHTACPPGPLREATDSSDLLEHGIDAATESDPHPAVMSRGSAVSRPTHLKSTSAGETFAATELGKRGRSDAPSHHDTGRSRWLDLPPSRGFLLPKQSVRLPRRAGTLAHHYNGMYTCKCCDKSGWAPATGFDPTFFMQCTTCDDVATGVLHLA